MFNFVIDKPFFINHLKQFTTMKKWKCNVCGYIHEGDTPPEECPLCGVGPEDIEEVTE